MPKLKKIPVRKPKHRALEMAMDLDPMFPPSLHFSGKQVPEIKKWEVGEKYRMIVEVEQTSKNENKDGTVSASFDVVAYKPLGSNYETMDDDEIEEEMANAYKS